MSDINPWLLIKQLNSNIAALEHKIKWAKYALQTPIMLTTPQIQSYRRAALLLLLQEQSMLYRQMLELKHQYGFIQHVADTLKAWHRDMNNATISSTTDAANMKLEQEYA
jgi:hypothetical protein